jgi:Zn-dependent protease with chaperone function
VGSVVVSELMAQGIRLRLSSRGGFGAWAWPSGRIEITRDLVDALDDQELAAALAHEAAHLVDEAAGVEERASLARGSGSEAIERAADRRGCSILADAGIPSEAMVRMLRKLSQGLREPRMLQARIAEASLVCRTSATGFTPL